MFTVDIVPELLLLHTAGQRVLQRLLQLSALDAAWLWLFLLWD
jgi:hypothetical protein